jgi:hypothetical protein
LRQRLQYFYGQFKESIDTGTSCLQNIKTSGPGRLDEYIDCKYYLAKAKIRMSDFAGAQLALELQPLIGPAGSRVSQRFILTMRIGHFLLSHSEIEANSDDLRSVLQELAVFENATGVMTDALDDGLLLRSGCWPEGDRSNSALTINAMRGNFGARLYQLPVDVASRGGGTRCTAI